MFFLCGLMVIAPYVAHAAKLGDVQMPDTLQVDGKTLHLNGYGLRKYSIFGIHIYVASLYLESIRDHWAF